MNLDSRRIKRLDVRKELRFQVVVKILHAEDFLVLHQTYYLHGGVEIDINIRT